MKKKLAKFVNEISKKFPEAYEVGHDVEVMTGSELIEKGVTKVGGKEVDLKKRYTSTNKKFKKIDHYRKLKRFKAKHGKNFIAEYMKWLQLHMQTMRLKYPDAFKAA